jgi:putative ABC transport system substrate-binding protein
MVKLAPDVIITLNGAPLRVAREQTKTIPIVFLSGEGADTGENIARPEANVTGFRSTFVSLGGKWLELLKEAAPNVTRVAYLVTLGGRTTYLASVEPAARALGVQLVTIPVSDRKETARRDHGQAILLSQSDQFPSHGREG